jgi:hypothetical protein
MQQLVSSPIGRQTLEMVAPASLRSGSGLDLSSIDRRKRSLVHLAMAPPLAAHFTGGPDRQVFGQVKRPDKRPSTLARTKHMKKQQ